MEGVGRPLHRQQGKPLHRQVDMRILPCVGSRAVAAAAAAVGGIENHHHHRLLRVREGVDQNFDFRFRLDRPNRSCPEVEEQEPNR